MTPPELQFRTIDIARIERTYWIPDDQPRAPAPLLIAFHGLGMTGRRLALSTGLAERGPACARFATAFPDALGRVWDDHGTVRRDGGDDIAFVDTLITLACGTSQGAAGDRPVFLVGLSNGAAFAERIARTAAVEVAGVALVAGTAREASRTRTPQPRRPTPMLAILGTADTAFPFEGGRSRSRFRRQASLRVRLALSDTSGHEVVAARTLIDDWTQGRADAGEPVVERLEVADGDPPVTRLTWSSPPALTPGGGSDPGSPGGSDLGSPGSSDLGSPGSTVPPVVLYRVEGGGHVAAGRAAAPGPQAARLFGRIPKQFDATGTDPRIRPGGARLRRCRRPRPHTPRATLTSIAHPRPGGVLAVMHAPQPFLLDPLPEWRHTVRKLWCYGSISGDRAPVVEVTMAAPARCDRANARNRRVRAPGNWIALAPGLELMEVDRLVQRGDGDGVEAPAGRRCNHSSLEPEAFVIGRHRHLSPSYRRRAVPGLRAGQRRLRSASTRSRSGAGPYSAHSPFRSKNQGDQHDDQDPHLGQKELSCPPDAAW